MVYVVLFCAEIRNATQALERGGVSLGEVVRRLGSNVYRVTTADGQVYAAKICKLPTAEEEETKSDFPLGSTFGQLENECALLTGSLEGCEGVPVAKFLRTDSHLILLQQPVGQSLATCSLPADPEKRDELLLRWATRLVHMHRDIKPENIIVTKDTCELFIIDFGFSIMTKDRLSWIAANFQVGTPAYGSANYHAQLPLTPYDDFESLALSIEAARHGVRAWLISSASDDTAEKISKLRRDSSIARHIFKLVGRRHMLSSRAATWTLSVFMVAVAAAFQILYSKQTESD
jgi:serine/threonine protein kinase